MKIHSFKHRTYWYSGEKREAMSLRAVARLIRRGDVVFDVGGHVGYLAVDFSDMVGPSGSVVVFEPGENNLPYLMHNTRELGNVEVEKKAVSDFVGSAGFTLEDLTGQNNSLLQDYEVLRRNEQSAGVKARRIRVEVRCTTLDAYVRSRPHRRPAFVKIDVEGAELAALRGMRDLLSGPIRPRLMVEVTRDADKVAEHLAALDYRAWDARGRPVSSDMPMAANWFCLHQSDGAGLAALTGSEPLRPHGACPAPGEAGSRNGRLAVRLIHPDDVRPRHLLL